MTVTHPDGIHARPAVAIVKRLGQFTSQVRVYKGGEVADARSPLDLMSLGAANGAELLLTAEGPDAAETLDSLQEFFADEFGLAEE